MRLIVWGMHFGQRLWRALRFWRCLHYRWRLAWVKAKAERF